MDSTLTTWLVTYYDEEGHERTAIVRGTGFEVTDHGDLIVHHEFHSVAAYARSHWAAIVSKSESEG